MKRFVLLGISASALLVAAMSQGWLQEQSEAAARDYEVWVTVQGSHEIHVLAPTGQPRGSDLEIIATIDYTDTAFIEQWGVLRNPHMILFGLHGRPGSKYGFVSNVSSANTSVIDADAREVVAVLPTGTRTHAVQPSPDGSRALALAIGTDGIAKDLCDGSGAITATCGRVTEIITDLDEGTFALSGRSFALADFADLPGADALHRFDPICGSFTPDSQFFYVTLWSGGLVIFEVNSDASEPLFSVVNILPPGSGSGEIAAHGCGVGYSTDGRLMFANSGSGMGSFYYVFDIATHSLVQTVDLSDTMNDLHGMMLSPLGAELVMAGRGSDNFVVINQKTGELKPSKTFTSEPAEAPDLTDFSPDGKWVYVTLRGPNPSTGAHDTGGNTPGVAVVHFAPGKVIRVVPLPGDQQLIDPHGIAIRRLDR